MARRSFARAFIAAVFLLATACSSDRDATTPTATPTAPTPTPAVAASTTSPGPVLPPALQRLVDATSLRDLDASYPDIALPSADSHIAVVVEDIAAITAPPRANATVSDYVNSLLRVDGTIPHYVTEFETDSGVLECHILAGFGNCASPAAPDTWQEPIGYFGDTQGEVFEAIYTVRNDAVLIDTVSEDGSRQRSEPPGGIVFVTADGTRPATLTIYLADGSTDTFDLRSPPDFEPESAIEDE